MLYCIKYTHAQTERQRSQIPSSRAPVGAKKFVWVGVGGGGGGGWVKTKSIVWLRSKSMSFEFSELDFAGLRPS